MDALPAHLFWTKLDFARQRRREDQMEQYRVGAFIGYQLGGMFAGEGSRMPPFEKYLKDIGLGHEKSELSTSQEKQVDEQDKAFREAARKEEARRAIEEAEKIVRLDTARAEKRKQMGLDPGPVR